MMLRILGAIFLVLGCSGVGFGLSAAYKKELATLKTFIESLDMMECELTYRRTSLPLLCHYIAAKQAGVIRLYFQNLEKELLRQVQPSAASCAFLALEKTQQLPRSVRELIYQLARSLGEFDIDGQVLGIQAVKKVASQKLHYMTENQELRMKNYRTFGICAGVAIVILFI